MLGLHAEWGLVAVFAALLLKVSPKRTNMFRISPVRKYRPRSLPVVVIMSFLANKSAVIDAHYRVAHVWVVVSFLRL